MAVDKKISQLASGAPAQAGDEYVVARSGANYKLTLTNIAASMPATTITTGNLTFSSTAQRITGDFSNATYSNRVAFQTSTASSNTLIPILNTQASNGASVFQFYNNNDTTNNSFAQIGIGGSALQLVSGQNGTGSYFPIVMSTGGSERVRIDTSGNVGIGTTSTGFNAAGLPLVVGSGSGNTGMTIYSGTASSGSIHFGDTVTTGADGYRGFLNYTHSTNSMQFGTDATERMRIDSSGNVLVTNPAGLGYGTGAGGTVTQATNKNTGVTLNKPSGQIITSNSALPAGAIAGFQFNNTLLASTDVLVLSIVTPNTGTYQTWVYYSTAGYCFIAIKHNSGTSLSDAVTINFAIIKGVTS
jgi:hypothetical protein